ncbi:radical SAM protein [Candidatus Auribacterota bacterium]
MKILSAPLKVSLEITNMCNLSCIHCNVAGTKNMPGDLTASEWKNLIDELAGLKVFNLIISGGEPFMRPDIFELIEHIFKHHFRVRINTNGTLIDRNTARLLKQYDRIENIQVSLDGSSPEIHEKIRSKDSYKRTIAGIRDLISEDLPVTTYTVINRINLGDIENIIRLGKDLRIAQATFTDLLPVGHACKTLGTMEIDQGERRELSEQFTRLQNKYGNFIGGPMVKTESFFSGFADHKPSPEDNGSDGTFSSCAGCFEECCVRPDGWVVPCSRMWEYKTGNVRNKRFRDIWHNSEKTKEFRARRKVKVNDVDECRSCEYIPLCRGGCPAVPFEYGRGITGWDPTSCYKVYTGEKESYIK